MDNYDPANLNTEQLLDLCQRYGGKWAEQYLDRLASGRSLMGGTQEDRERLDDWASCGIEKAEDIKDLFVRNFYFGCEADDPMNATAFNARLNPFGARLKAIFSSDIGHWDVPDMEEVLEEAFELVEHELITADDFRDFVFTNPTTLWTGTNPDFFQRDGGLRMPWTSCWPKGPRKRVGKEGKYGLRAADQKWNCCGWHWRGPLSG